MTCRSRLLDCILGRLLGLNFLNCKITLCGFRLKQVMLQELFYFPLIFFIYAFIKYLLRTKLCVMGPYVGQNCYLHKCWNWILTPIGHSVPFLECSNGIFSVTYYRHFTFFNMKILNILKICIRIQIYQNIKNVCLWEVVEQVFLFTLYAFSHFTL